MRWLGLALALWLAPGLGPIISAAESGTPPNPLLQRVGLKQGLAVVVGDPKAELALQLARQTDLLIYLQLADAAQVAQARQAVDNAGFYGTRIYVEQGPLEHLFLAENLADVVVAGSDAAAIPQSEALRVLHPQGRALLGQQELTKPAPAGLDDWSHPYHGPDNNPLSQDKEARAPYLTHFLADPRYAPLPQVAVAAGGRVFKAFGHIAFKTREEPWLNTLAAFNGYNGTLLWRREITPALMVHRNTLIATPTKVFFGDDQSCKVLDAASGALLDEIVPPEQPAGETFWKWMALDNGVLYALVGDPEERDPVIRQRRTAHGWPWDPLSPGYNQKEHTWGYGRTLLAIDPESKRVLWRHRETGPVDSRALCMKSGRIYAFRFGEYLTCIDASTGQEIWRKTKDNAPALFAAIGPYQNRQDWRTNWRTSSYLKCSDRALYFAGPAVDKLLALSTVDGGILWEHPYNNYQIVLREDGLYGLGGQIDKDPTRVFDPLTGKILAEIPLGRRACTRVTGSIDALFCRANGGSTRLDVESNRPELVSPMRPNCHDGVTIANGLLYWWPSVCDCNLTLYGITCLGPAGDFKFEQAAASDRLERAASADAPIAPLADHTSDWPTFRANNRATVTTEAVIPIQTSQLWQFRPAAPFTPTAPTAAGDLVFLGGSDGVVRAFQARDGQLAWKAYTGGAIRYPPTAWKDRAFVGSGDGWVYAFEARTGRLLWRFRAAPAERRIPVYGTLQATWPVGSGVLVADGVLYAAAGIVNYDGTHVYALDALTGKLKWQNNTSGHLDPELRTGVSVQGHMVLQGGQLYLAGGNAVSPAVYDIRDGKCVNEQGRLQQRVNNNLPGSFSPRGNELYCLGNNVMVSGKPHYAHPQYEVYDDQVFNKTLLAENNRQAVAWVNNSKLVCLDRQQPDLHAKLLAAWGKLRIPDLKITWQTDCKTSRALALGPNAVLAAKESELVAYDVKDGRELWTQKLPEKPVHWGLAVNRHGRLLVALEDGRLLCVGQDQRVQ